MRNFKERGEVIIAIGVDGYVAEQHHMKDIIETAFDFIKGEDADEWVRVLRIDPNASTDRRRLVSGVVDITHEVFDAWFSDIDILEWDEKHGCPALCDEKSWGDLVDEAQQDAAAWAKGPEYYYGVPARL